MRKVIAALNMTLDGVCDHTAGIPDEDLHRHYSELIDHSGMILYGRKTYELMRYWQDVLQNPENPSQQEFAISIDRIPKMVFSNTLHETHWNSAVLADKPLPEKVLELKAESGNDILVGSRSLIIQLLKNHLVDEFQICVHPVIEGKGLRLFDEIQHRIMLKLTQTKTLPSGAIVLYYKPVKG